MRGPGVLATALLFRRLARELEQTNKLIARLAETEELRLKLEAVRANIPLSAIREAEEIPASDETIGEPSVLAQTDSELALEQRLVDAYVKAFGHEPSGDEDLIELVRGGGERGQALRHAGEEAELGGEG